MEELKLVVSIPFKKILQFPFRKKILSFPWLLT